MIECTSSLISQSPHPVYVELHCASAFSFLQGASLPEMLIDRAAELEYPALALLDRDGVYGAPRFHKAARAAGVRPIIGAELSLNVEARTEKLEGVLTSQFVLPVLCESQDGYRNLCRLITRMKMRAPKGEGALTLDDLEGSTAGLVALVGRAALSGHRFGVGGLVDRLVGMFGRDRVYVEIQRHFRRDEHGDNQTLIDLADAFHVPVVATGGVRFATPASRPLFDVLTCIHHHTDLKRAGRRLAPNAERYLKSSAAMTALFADMPKAVARTRELADRLQYTMADLGYKFPDYPVPPGETQATFLRKITDVG
ncbi:MAG TPA: PHP domain-containing protein, partial [Vicinamibacterales bacterium]|nr:PHP domain-containing protein [Vicinamibacterales bacterium]